MPFVLNEILAAWIEQKPKKYNPLYIKTLKHRSQIKQRPVVKKYLPFEPINVQLEYATYRNMLARCSKPNTPGYKYYGGNGIQVCERWKKNFHAFINDMGPRPSIDYSIDRIDPSKGYEPSNCRWLPKKLNSSRKYNIKMT